ncbi:hypothetical protein AVEN_117353-1 [Araneus ventricosus]|uniref:Uncharacterized protein n=1 Tax=Araneus ventricosus TaxID=182803 RepID=A0A4Y2HZG9_ARAVE|nr:hypothetical protein AVEN_117353-1 [Araneus ventricosus]
MRLQSVMGNKQKNQFRKHLLDSIGTTQLVMYGINEIATIVVQSSTSGRHYIRDNDLETTGKHVPRFRVFPGFLLQLRRSWLSDLVVPPLLSHKRVIR